MPLHTGFVWPVAVRGGSFGIQALLASRNAWNSSIAFCIVGLMEAEDGDGGHDPGDVEYLTCRSDAATADSFFRAAFRSLSNTKAAVTGEWVVLCPLLLISSMGRSKYDCAASSSSPSSIADDDHDSHSNRSSEAALDVVVVTLPSINAAFSTKSASSGGDGGGGGSGLTTGFLGADPSSAAGT